jgi:hypothetical protein
MVRSGLYSNAWELTWTYSPARAVAVVISFLGINSGSQLRSKSCDTFIVIRIEPLRVWESIFVVMKAPSIDEDDSTLG